jgi:hypothetical protein
MRAPFLDGGPFLRRVLVSTNLRSWEGVYAKRRAETWTYSISPRRRRRARASREMPMRLAASCSSSNGSGHSIFLSSICGAAGLPPAVSDPLGTIVPNWRSDK